MDGKPPLGLNVIFIKKELAMFFKQKKLFNSGRYEIGDSEMGFWNVLSVENPELGQVLIRIRRSKPIIPF